MDEKPKLSGLFSFLEMVMDMAGLNVLFVLFCLPVVTGGAAMTALCAGLRAMIKKQPCFRTFFKTFAGSFWRSTAAWLLLGIPTGLMAMNVYTIAYYRADGSMPLLIASILMTLVLAGILYMIFLFYSRFECTLLQLFKYSGILAVNHFWRTLVIAAATCLPLALIPVMESAWFALLPLWVFFYYSIVSVGAIWLMNRPFARFARETMGYQDPKKEDEQDD